MAYSIRESSPEEIQQLTKYGWASPTISDSVAMTGRRGGSGDLISIGKNGNYNYINNSGGNTKVISEMVSDNKYQYVSGGSSGRKLVEGGGYANGGSSGGNFSKEIATSNGSNSYVKLNNDLRSGAAAGGNFDNGVKIGNSGGGVSYYKSNGDIIKNPSLVEGNNTYIGANGGKVVTGSKEYVESVSGGKDSSWTQVGQGSYYKSDSDSNSRAVNESVGYTESVSRGGSYVGVAGGVGAASSIAGGLGTLKLDLNNVGQFANSIEKCAEQLDNVWKKVQTKDIEVINNSWASEDAQEYVNKLNQEGEKIKYIVSSLKLLSKTYNSIASEGGNAQQDIGRMIRNI